MRALVTGATGLIGSHVVTQLLDRGDEVHAVSRSAAPAGVAARWHRADLAEIGSAEALVAAVAPDVIVHLAAENVGDRGLHAVLPTLQANLVAAVHVLDAAARHGRPRVLLAGSATQETRSDTDRVPRSPYGAAKLALHSYIDLFGAMYDLDVVNIRPTMVYGPGQSERKVLPYVIGSLLRGESPQVSSGAWAVDWVYVGDVAAAYVAATDRPGLAGQTIDLGSGEVASVRSVIERADRCVGASTHPTYGAREERIEDDAGLRIDHERTRSLLGWAPTVDLDEGIRRTVEWCRSLRATPDG